MFSASYLNITLHSEIPRGPRTSLDIRGRGGWRPGALRAALRRPPALLGAGVLPPAVYLSIYLGQYVLLWGPPCFFTIIPMLLSCLFPLLLGGVTVCNCDDDYAHDDKDYDYAHHYEYEDQR